MFVEQWIWEKSGLHRNEKKMTEIYYFRHCSTAKLVAGEGAVAVSNVGLQWKRGNRTRVTYFLQRQKIIIIVIVELVVAQSASGIKIIEMYKRWQLCCLLMFVTTWIFTQAPYIVHLFVFTPCYFSLWHINLSFNFDGMARIYSSNCNSLLLKST